VPSVPITYEVSGPSQPAWKV